jgi:thioredoxin-related protein
MLQENGLCKLNDQESEELRIFLLLIAEMMKKSIYILGAVVMLFLLSSSFKPAEPQIKWLTFEEAVVLMEKEPKKVFIDVYTDWCGWCKKMDASTFLDAEVIEEMNNNFYAVKLDAEQKEDILFNGHTFKFVDQGRRGYHELAAALLNGKLSYPSFVLMNEQMQIITPLPGYKSAQDLIPILTFIGEDHYLKQDWENYLKDYQSN